MNDITSISLSLKECLSNEADASNSSLNGNIDNEGNEKGNCKMVDIDKSEDTSKKGLLMMSVSSSMQDHQLTVLRSNKSLCLMSSDYNGNTGTLNAVASLTAESASFALLSRRESSLENLAEDENGLHNVCISPYMDSNTSTIVEKPTIIENTVNIPKKIESSRLRRTINSLLSCCTHKSRRSQYPYKSDIITSPVGDSDAIVAIDKCSNLSAHKQVSTRQGEGDHISFSCLKLKKFLDIFDESDSPGKRSQQSTKLDTNRPVTIACVTREIDKSESPSKNMKNTESFQSENGGTNLARPVLLGTIKPADQGKKCFIIDLDETLVHSSFKMVEKADFKVGVDIEGTVHTVYVLKRPYVDVFLQKMGRIFECVLFTASLAKYADPVTDFLDKWRVFRWRLFRESCVFHRGNYVKDLSMLGRQADQVAILDNSPASYMFHPDNAVQITSWFDDPRDTALLDLIPYFEQLAAAPSVPPFLASIKPPQRATVPVSVMLTTPTSISLQPVSQQQLQNQQHKSSSPITHVESSVITSSADHHHPNNMVITNVPQLSQFPIVSSLYIRSSLLTRSNISSKSLPSMMPSVEECFSTAVLKFSRSETDLSSLLSSVNCEIPIGAEHDIYPPPLLLLLPQQKSSKSTSDIPAVLTYDDIYPKSILNNLVSRSFPALSSNIDQKNTCYSNRASDNDQYESRNEVPPTNSIIEKTSLFPRSASFSVHIFRTENNTFRSRSSLCDMRITTTTTTTTGLFGSLFAD